MRSAAKAAGSLAVLAAGFGIGVLPALGASKTVNDNNGSQTWNPKALTIEPGDDVKWSWLGFHNVQFQDGQRSGDAKAGGSYERMFPQAGTFKYRCEIHGGTGTDYDSGMAGVITVQAAGGGTTPTTPTQTTPTGTTPTQTTPGPADTTAPGFSSLRRVPSRTAITLAYRLSEDANLDTTISRRTPGAKRFKRVEVRTDALDKGTHRVTLRRVKKGLPRGTWRLRMVLEDLAENRSAVRTLTFKVS
jgi:plastocyanin